LPETIALCPNARPSAKGQAEHFYHAFLLGLIARLGIRSNGQSGLGRYDICLIPRAEVLRLAIAVAGKEVLVEAL
jgi:hypothetical protein